jgi:hypothetical protein
LTDFQKIQIQNFIKIRPGKVELFHANDRHDEANNSRAVAAIQERVTAVLRSIPKEAFADSFQKLYESCQP